jgi:hypothetical protein
VRAAALAGILVLAGCSTAVAGQPVPAALTDRDLIAGYFRAFDTAADKGAAEQMEFLRRTQHPDFTDRLCDLGGLTVNVQVTLSTLRIDRKWAPEAGQRPRGEVYAVAVSLSISKDGQTLGAQIGSERVVVLDGAVYGFMPCLRES